MATTRQKLNRHFWAGWILVVALSGVLAGLHGLFNEAGWWFLALVVAAIGGVFVAMYRTRCVMCGAPLRRMGLWWRPGAEKNWSPPCPSCKKHIDRVEPFKR